MKQKKIEKKYAEKAIIFDSGALISFSMNGVLDIIKNLKSIFHGKFLITSQVKREVIDTPLNIRKFELEALKIRQLLNDHVLDMPSSLGIKDSEINEGCNRVMNTANSTFSGREKDIHIVDLGEASCIALSKILTEKGMENVIAIDERTTRLLVEKPENLKNIFQDRMETRISIRNQNLKEFKDFKIIRSPELAYVAYKKGLVGLAGDGMVLDALLYSLKFKGAAISGDEIAEIERMK